MATQSSGPGPRRSIRWSDEVQQGLRRLADHIIAQGPSGSTQTSPSSVARALITEGIERWRHRGHCEVERGDARELTRVVSFGVEAVSIGRPKPKPNEKPKRGQLDVELRLGDGSVRRFVVMTKTPTRTPVFVKEVPA